MTWVPLILAIWMAYMGLAMVVHKKWSDHECLYYPVATFAATLLPGKNEGLRASFSDRKFQVTAGIVLFIYLNNYVQVWFPDVWVEIPLRIDFTEVWRTIGIKHFGYLANPKIVFAAVGIAGELLGAVIPMIVGAIYYMIF